MGNQQSKYIKSIEKPEELDDVYINMDGVRALVENSDIEHTKEFFRALLMRVCKNQMIEKRLLNEIKLYINEKLNKCMKCRVIERKK